MNDGKRNNHATIVDLVGMTDGLVVAGADGLNDELLCPLAGVYRLCLGGFCSCWLL